MSFILSGCQSLSIGNKEIRRSDQIVIYSYIRRSDYGVCILLSKITGHSCLQSNHVCFTFCRSDIGMLTTKCKVNSSCSGILDRLSDDIYQIAACRASSSFNNSYSTVKIAISSIRQIEALRIEMVAGNYRSTYRKIILSRN